jgi:hypothetical protein
MGISAQAAPVLAVALITWGGVFFYLLRMQSLIRSVEKEVERRDYDKNVEP